MIELKANTVVNYTIFAEVFSIFIALGLSICLVASYDKMEILEGLPLFIVLLIAFIAFAHRARQARKAARNSTEASIPDRLSFLLYYLWCNLHHNAVLRPLSLYRRKKDQKTRRGDLK